MHSSSRRTRRWPIAEHVSTPSLSVVNADDQHRALALLDRAVKERYPLIIELTKDPDLDALRETERFQEIEGAIKSLYR